MRAACRAAPALARLPERVPAPARRLLHWFAAPYVQRLRYSPTTDSVEVTTLNVLARPRTTSFHLGEVRAQRGAVGAGA